MPSRTDAIDSRWGELSPLHDPYILANFSARTTDVLITTPPKSGTTWMQQILHQLRSGGDTDFKAIDDVVPWLERQRKGQSWQQILQDFEKLPDPRVFKTHCTAEQTPGIGTAKIILTSRDPRDCCVSFYHHIMNLTDEARIKKEMPCPDSFEQHVDMWLEFASWYRSMKSWWPYYDHPDVLWLRYQDLKNDLSTAVDQITAHLSWSVTAEEKEKVLKYSSFAWMKANDEKFSGQGADDKPVFKPGKFINQGKIGSYKNLMTADQEARILSRAKETLAAECLKFLELDV